MSFRILFLGDIVGEPGRRAVIQELPALREELSPDIIIANGENAAGGRGITSKIAIDLLRAGVSVITTGDHAFDQHEISKWWPTEPRLIRPINYPSEAPGHGSCIIDTDKGAIAVLQAQGLIYMNQQLNNPIAAIEEELEFIKEKEQPDFIFIDFHAEATSEKQAFGHALDGKVSAIVGTHTHVQTADERILPKGTGFLCDAGMCGPYHSVLGREVEPSVERFRTQTPRRLPVASWPVDICGVLVYLDEKTGDCIAIERVRHQVHLDGQEPSEEDKSESQTKFESKDKDKDTKKEEAENKEEESQSTPKPATPETSSSSLISQKSTLLKPATPTITPPAPPAPKIQLNTPPPPPSVPAPVIKKIPPSPSSK